MNRELVFPVSEYERRVRRVKESMDRQGMEALLVLDPAGMNYLTGFDGWSFYVHQGVIIFLNDPYPFWFGRMQDSNAARLLTWLPEDHICGYKDEYVQSRYIHTMEYVAGLIRGRGTRLGVEMDGYWFNAKMMLTLQKELPGIELRDATNLVNWVKTIKTPEEITFIREAARITEEAMRTALEVIRVGVPEREAAALVSAQQIRGTGGYGGDSPAIFPIMPSAERTSSAHLTFSTDRKYQNQDVVLLELGSARHHYHAPLSRTLYLGTPPADLQRTADVVVNGLQKTLATIAPGMTAEEVEQTWRSCLAGTGVEKPSRVGYSFGLSYVPDWGEHTVSLRPGDKTVLEPGMTIHFMPGIWLDTYGFECSEPFLVTSDGCEKLIDFPEELFIR
jgi:ectoine hydrolase